MGLVGHGEVTRTNRAKRHSPLDTDELAAQIRKRRGGERARIDVKCLRSATAGTQRNKRDAPDNSESS
jgi:hypothetical protein